MTRRLQDLLKLSPELRALAHQSGKLQALQRRYAQFVPEALHRASRVVRLERGQLTLLADNSAVAAKLRQMTLDLIDLFNESGVEVTGIRIRVQVRGHTPRPAPAPRPLSAVARRELDHLAEALPDSPLKATLRRLLARAG